MDIFISELLSLDYVVAKQKLRVYPRLQVVGATTPFAESGYSYAVQEKLPMETKVRPCDITNWRLRTST